MSTPAGRPRSQSKLKTAKHAATCGTFIISCNSNISHSLTCPKTWGKGPKRKKYLSLTIKHSSLVPSIQKEN